MYDCHTPMMTTTTTTDNRDNNLRGPCTVFVLHGSRQTGDLLLGRMDKLRKRLAKDVHVHLVAPTGSFPHPEDTTLRQWWQHEAGTNAYHGFADVTVPQLVESWNRQTPGAVGFLGFSQGARLAHLLTVLHQQRPEHYFPGLRFTIAVAGYDAPLPDGMRNDPLGRDEPRAVSTDGGPLLLTTPSLHVWGASDALITPAQSQALADRYRDARYHVHGGGHHVPMRAASVRTLVDFIRRSLLREEGPSDITHDNHDTKKDYDDKREQRIASTTIDESTSVGEPDEETKQAQQDEVEAMMAIFPDEFQLLSDVTTNDDDDEQRVYAFPIHYRISLEANDEGVWPPRPVQLDVRYPPAYPQSTGPNVTLQHENNVLEFSTARREACHEVIRRAAREEHGMPCVYACYAAAKEFFESGAMAHLGVTTTTGADRTDAERTVADTTATRADTPTETTASTSSMSTASSIRPASAERLRLCNQQGLDIAASILQELGAVRDVVADTSSDSAQLHRFKGGNWMYTVGLVGKPSAGKSTFFNAATAFARQRDDADNPLGGASMAPHPFTTIDPNVGFCLVPAPEGLCPEDDDDDDSGETAVIGSTHGRDPRGRRLLPVLLKDVAGLVPGAYQGRGRGNKFLNDLTDADVLVHVLDVSGTADVEGNDLGLEDDGKPHGAASHPLDDMEWIRRELIEWVCANLYAKWTSVTRKGRSKLMGMFSGYGQNQGLLWTILNAVEKFMEKHENRDHALDNVDDWDEGDVRRLVSAFLGVRFPMTLALNKSDLPTSQPYIADIQEALPVHGAYSGSPLCAQEEMVFVKKRLEQHLTGSDEILARETNERSPQGVWSCLTSALSLHEPVLVFPVTDFVDYAPLPGLTRYATEDASLPSVGMISCLRAAGGQAPSLWDTDTKQYVYTRKTKAPVLRDVLVMKPGSTVDDVFIALKNRRALEGEFVRAEGAGRLGSPSRPVPKHQLVNTSNRILKIMTTKKTAWQHNYRS